MSTKKIIGKLVLTSALVFSPPLALSGCSPKPRQETKIEDPNISITNPSFRAPAPGQTTGAAYFDIVNTGGGDVLTSASSPFSGHIELHTHLHEDGVMKMRQVDNVKAKGGETTHFKRGGLHVMMFNVQIPEGAMSVPLTLNFKRSGGIQIDALIANLSPSMGAMNHDKMKHGMMKHGNKKNEKQD